MSATSVIASLPWPMPVVSTSIRSKPTAWQVSIARAMQSAISRPLPRLANERMKSSSSASEFILILSPKSAPPVLLRVGSVASSATFASGLSRLIRSINSSVRLDFPAPPVPVSPTTGQPAPASTLRQRSRTSRKCESEPFSAKVNNFAISPWSLAETGLMSEAKRASSSKSRFDASSIASPTIPVRPRLCPSSGE